MMPAEELANSISNEAKLVTQSIVEETGGESDALRARSILARHPPVGYLMLRREAAATG